MIGWLVAWKCLVACVFFESSQQPTCPQVRQRRRCTQLSPIFKQSSHPLALGVTSRIWSRWLHCCAICFCSPSLMLLDALASFRKDQWQQKRLQHPPLFLKDCIPASSIEEVLCFSFTIGASPKTTRRDFQWQRGTHPGGTVSPRPAAPVVRCLLLHPSRRHLQ